MTDVARMANDIARFWQAYPESEAIEMFAEHINKFWDPTLRNKLFEQDQEQLLPLVVNSIDKVRSSKYNPVKVEFKDKTGTGG